MNNRTRIILSIMVVLVLPVLTYSAEQNSVFSLIDQEYNDNLISYDQKVILLIDAIQNPEKLPDKYQLLATSTTTIKCPTGILFEIKQNWDRLSPETQQYFSTSLARTSTAFTYNSPSGYFKLHYDTTGTDGVNPEDLNTNFIPDFIELMAEYCDSALYHHQTLGYLLPPTDYPQGGDSLYDIYFEESSYYGKTVPEAPGPESWSDFTSYIVLNNDFLGFAPNNDPEGNMQGAAKVTCIHEFHHAIQLAYDGTEGIWYLELDATHIEEIGFDLVDDNYQYLPTFFDNPQLSLFSTSSLHHYSSFIWNLFLSEKFDTTQTRAGLEGAINETIFNATADTLMGRYGWSIDSAFAEFTYWNYATGSRDDGNHYEEASGYPEILVSRTHASYPVNTQNSPTSLPGYSSTYITFYPPATPKKLRVTFNGSDSREWSAYVIKQYSPTNHSIEYIPLDSITYYGQLDVHNFHLYESVTLVGVNTAEFADAALFTYSANILQPYNVSSQIISTDSVVYSGGTRDIEYKVNNTSLVNDVYDIIVWDSLGWVFPETTDVSIFSGDSTILPVPVNPPVYTPLDQYSKVYCKVISWNDSTVVDSQSVTAITVLQRGDLDFSGTVDISDILYFVDYSFAFGPPPIPVELAADFDCSGTVDVSDLLAMLDYAFISGPACPCNPY